jgi:hypothetical protein
MCIRKSASGQVRMTETRKYRQQFPIRRFWIQTAADQPRIECRFSDVSDDAATLEVFAGRELPDQFVLLFTLNGSVRRSCQVVWRHGAEIGVTFIGRPPFLIEQASETVEL